MNKRDAFKILVDHSYLLPERAKTKILTNLGNLTDEEIDKIGYLLAVEKKNSLEKNSEISLELDNIIDKLH